MNQLTEGHSYPPGPATGTVRIQNTGTSLYADSDETTVEVMQDDGTWLRVIGICSVTIHVSAHSLVTADMTVELSSFDMAAFPLQLIRPRWWHSLVPSWLRSMRLPAARRW